MLVDDREVIIPNYFNARLWRRLAAEHRRKHVNDAFQVFDLPKMSSPSSHSVALDLPPAEVNIPLP